MKYGLALLLFVFFALSLSAVKFADGYSQRFERCAASNGQSMNSMKLRSTPTKIEDADRPHDNFITIDIKPCPALKHSQRDWIIKLLKN